VFPRRFEQAILAETAEFAVKEARLGSQTEVFGDRLAADRDLIFHPEYLARVFLAFLQAISWRVGTFLALSFLAGCLAVHHFSSSRTYPRLFRGVKTANGYCYFPLTRVIFRQKSALCKGKPLLFVRALRRRALPSVARKNAYIAEKIKNFPG